MGYFFPVFVFDQSIDLRWTQLCFALLFLSFLYLGCQFIIKKQKKLIRIRWPLLDILPSLLYNIHEVHEWTVKFSNLVNGTVVVRGAIFGSSKLLYTCDPRNIEHMAKTKFYNYQKGSDFFDTFDLIGNGIFNVECDQWRAQRKLAHTRFTSRTFRSTVASVTHAIVQDALLPLLSHVAKHEQVVDLEDVMLRFSYDSIFRLVFGGKSNTPSIEFPENELAKAIDDGTEAIFFRNIMPSQWWKLLRWLKLGKEKKSIEAGKTIDKYLYQYISSKRDEMNQGVEANDLLASYIMTSNKNPSISKFLPSLDDKFLRDTALTFLFAGRDTTGTSLTWFFWLVSKSPRLEQKILEELKEVLALKYTHGDMGIDEEKSSLKVFNSEELKDLVYLHAALCESMRLYPPLPINRRIAVNDDVLPNGTFVKQGTRILMSYYAMARMKWVWGEDCHEFKPERWIDENGKLSSEPLTKFFSFNGGPRNCIGQEMAFTQMKSVVASVLCNFEIKLLEGHVVQPKPSLILHTKYGLKVRVKERVSLL
ncbi:hypothetical protein C5167_008231 [Papaver somniferum]|uniref:Cytochrome P450 n=1 Tax=Papaver somniferum TaxID=3469 RepID=A0A4Y7JWV4_PAPSO|nr:alkane hydroxylase MAH1-like [Papaver somniferum]RZC64542.1 hypothetical protein C5167_008231 [Papaver somniferum]